MTDPVERGARTQIIHINSQNRISGTPGNFTVNFKNELFKVDRPNGVIRVEPIQVVLHRSWYSVDTTCNTFQISNGTETLDYTIDVGFYNVESFLFVLQGLLPTWIVGYDPVTSRYWYQPPNDGNTYTLLFPTYAAHLLGFNINTTATVSYDAPIYSSFPAKMTIETVILVHINFPRQRYTAVDNLNLNSPDFQESDIFVKCPVNVMPFDTLVWRANAVDVVAFDLALRNIDSLNIYLTDEYGRAINPPYDWTISFRNTYFENADPFKSIQTTLTSIANFLHYIALEDAPKKLERKKADSTPRKKKKNKSNV